jgi:hypothetical protein
VKEPAAGGRFPQKNPIFSLDIAHYFLYIWVKTRKYNRERLGQNANQSHLEYL